MSNPVTPNGTNSRTIDLNALGRSRWSWHVGGRLAKLALGLAMLACLYSFTKWHDVLDALRDLDASCLTSAFLLFIPQTLLTAYRWRRLALHLRWIPLRQSVGDVLAGSALNLILPAKLGDVWRLHGLSPNRKNLNPSGVPLLLLEKVMDAAALGLLLLLGTLGCGARELLLGLVVLGIACRFGYQSPEARSLRRELGWYGCTSLILWTLHLWQIDLFLQAAGVTVGWSSMSARVPIAIFAGLIPLTLMGLGTRDTALVVLFANVASQSAMSAVGLLTATRYLVPGVVGIFVIVARALRAEEAAGSDENVEPDTTYFLALNKKGEVSIVGAMPKDRDLAPTK